MWPYWLLLSFHALLPALFYGKTSCKQLQGLAWIIIFVALTGMIGLRHEVGGDWAAYIEHIEITRNQTLIEALSWGDPGYNFLNWLNARFFIEPYFVNLICAGIFAFGLIKFSRSLPNPWIPLVIAVPYLVIIVAMGYTRQATAVGLLMLGLSALKSGKAGFLLVCIVAAMLFHKTAAILLILPMMYMSRSQQLVFLGLAGALLLAAWTRFNSIINTLISGYIDAEYSSTGALIRLSMNALPALIYLFFSRHFELKDKERSVWRIMSFLAIILMAAYFISPSSTALDRISLYLIPLQLFVASHLVATKGGGNWSTPVIYIIIVIYAFFIQFVWLFFAANRTAWIPYQLTHIQII